MSDSTVLRAGRKLIGEIDKYRRHLEREAGVEITRQAAAHAIFRLGLRAVKAQRAAKRG